ncbi:MAG: 2-oxoglutarate dehydrogenase, E2 component, dihydrolipoamide succinyltransferase [Bacteroidota bacterium]|nr:2-oxoglutarate dehydrogenase, E2 component, dihydrolipoamide succinyltransferase [Candidatus Kapabacteria bacterium]MDW8220785.1 2-oxoglutarate dehydrogenase, E2 component, dihydrolipoamide succinyltransferase [Bacteroidota bacterium]
MAKIDVVMPKMGESIQEGKILNWLKKVGDRVERDETLLEISTDKVDTEVPAPAAGVVAQILFNVGDTVEVGTVIAYIETDVSATVPSAAPTPPPAPAAAPLPPPALVSAAPSASVGQSAPSVSVSEGGIVDVIMPKMGESIQEGKILNWLKREGDKVERDEALLEISTDKVDTEVPAPASGVLAKILFQVGDTVEVGAVIARIATSATVPPSASTAPTSPAMASASNAPASIPAPANVMQAPMPPPMPAVSSVPAGNSGGIARISSGRFYSPLVRSIAKVEGITQQELDSIVGTGLEGRVTKHDVLAYLQTRRAKPAPSVHVPQTSTTVVPTPAPTAARVVAEAPSTASAQVSIAAPSPTILTDEQIYKKYGQQIEIIPMDRVRERIAVHMVQSVHTSPHVTLIAEADVTNIVRLRERYKAEFEQREGQKLTFTPFFIYAIVEAVKRYPMVNVSVEGTKIIRHKNIHCGMATALPDGNLIVPVIKHADMQSFTGIARSVNDLAARARAKKLTPDDISGGTITLTNFGTFHILTGTPIINQPQCAIVGLGAIEKRPVVRELDGQDVVVVRSMSYISVTVDHRVIDGMLGGQFLKAIVDTIHGMNEQNVRM